MNGKKAKKLRSTANGMTVGKPWSQYVRKPVGKNDKTTSNRGTITLNKGTGRKLYKVLKHGITRAEP